MGIDLAVKRTLDRPIMRQAQVAPFGVVERVPFGTFGFSLADWGLMAAFAFSIVPVVEAVKWMARRGRFGELV